MTETEEPKPSPQVRWNNENPKAIWAHSALRSALKKGLTKQEPCEICGDPNTEGHHDDYDKPMIVRWLCRLHHRRHHAQQRKAEAVSTERKRA